MRRSLALALAAALTAALSITLIPTPSSASNPSNATISFAHPKQVFVQSHTMQGGARAGFVQTICVTQPQACDPVTFSVDASGNGNGTYKIPNNANVFASTTSAAGICVGDGTDGNFAPLRLTS